MYCEITITTRKDIDVRKCTSKIKEHYPNPKRLSKKKVIAMTIWRDKDVPLTLMHAQGKATRALLFYEPDNQRVLKVHLEDVTEQSVAKLRDEFQILVTGMERLIHSIGNRSIQVKVTISAEGKTVLRLRKTTWWHRARKLIWENFLYKLFVPLIALVFSYLFSADIGQAALNALSASVAMLAWLGLSAGIISTPFPYEEEK